MAVKATRGMFYGETHAKREKFEAMQCPFAIWGSVALTVLMANMACRSL